MDLENWLLYFAAVLVATASPGPAILIGVNHGVTYGLRRAAFTTLGCITATSLMALASAVGLGALLLASESAFQILRWIGGGYLIWMGSQMILSKSGLQVKETGKNRSDSKHPFRCYRDGFLVSASNPKAMIFFGALFPLFLNPEGNIALQFTIMLATFVPCSFGFIMGYATLASKAAPFLGRQGFTKWFNRVTGGIFIGIGGFLALSDQS